MVWRPTLSKIFYNGKDKKLREDLGNKFDTD